MSIQAFTIAIAQSTLDDVRERLARIRWPDEVQGAGWDYGSTGYVAYPFQNMCADDGLHPFLFLFIHITGKLFRIALYSLILEQIC